MLSVGCGVPVMVMEMVKDYGYNAGRHYIIDWLL